MNREKKDHTGRSMANGLNDDAFEKALESASDINSDPNFERFATAEDYKRSKAGHGAVNYWPRQPGSSHHGDPFENTIKPKNVKFWDKPPATPAEESIYYGVHIHSESNPLGLHSHMPGGKLSGGHTHGPQNRLGVHHHQEADPEVDPITLSYNLDGSHTHEHGENAPCGKHVHSPENFG